MGYTKLQYNGIKTNKITNQSELTEELNKALDAGFDTVKKIEFNRQLNGAFSGRAVEMFYKKGSWRTK